MVLFVADISEHQGNVSMSTWRSVGIQGCIAKALEGVTYHDPQWAANKAKVVDAGIVPGAYHYINNMHSGAEQARAFVAVAPANFIHAIDVEAPGPIDLEGYFTEYRKHYPEKPVLIYTNHGMWRQICKLPEIDAAARYTHHLWVAGSAPGLYQPGTDDFRNIWKRVRAGSDGGLPFLGWQTYDLMQYSGSATVPGVARTGNCDMSVFGGTVEQLKAFTGTGKVDDVVTSDEMDQIAQRTAAAILTSGLYRDKWTGPDGTTEPLTVMRVLDEIFRRSDDAVQLTPATAQALVNAVSQSTADKLASGVHVDPTDPAQLKTLLGEVLDEHLQSLRIVSEPTPPQH
jgi:GH25 family lysozyme M1 (1,4-beta-N-acetylmuramidase)